MASVSGAQVVEVSLAHPNELFELRTTEWWAPERLYESGAEHCLRVLRSRGRGGPVEVRITLPEHEVVPETEERLASALRRYCTQRMAANELDARATRHHGLESLLPGIPLAVAGLLIVFLAARLVERHGNPNLVLETIGGVLAWVGLWFPLDTLVFSSLACSRENRFLRRLHDATVTVRPRPADRLTG